jgi:squalene-associated FAD-dependent desaturase
MRQLTIVGAGWAGLSAAVAATQAGWQVHLHEAAHQAGGRARRLPDRLGFSGLDNGQHILIGAYRDTLALMRTVGVEVSQAFLRIPLDLRDPQGNGLHLPDWPAPWNVLAGIASARGWSWRDKLSLLKACMRWQLAGFQYPSDWTVAHLCESSQLSSRIGAELIDPLCLSALNTHPWHACANVFLRVLHDALFMGRGASDMLLPRADLSTLFVEPCLAWLKAHGATIHLGSRLDAATLAHQDGPVLLACPAWDAARLTSSFAPAWSQQANALTHEAIATVYLHCTDMPADLPPVMALPHAHDAPEATPAQFVFDRQALLDQTDLLAAVVSAHQGNTDTLSDRVRLQVQSALNLPHVQVVQTVVEKRATLHLSPGLARPPAHIKDHWWACGDYVAGPYPSTLEGAVRCGHNVVAQLMPLTSKPQPSSHV